MSDRSGASRVILSGLAVGAILGAPAVAAGSAALAAGSSAVRDCSSAGDEVQSAVASIREQFEASFTPGAVAEAVSPPTPVICETS
ncbi:hypothetical protein ACIBSW_12040 [Actinoplanes sp. NPDC049668]|uniref:hypothetical protein n=1 Tax=unclassified Actinoplanes TaxID=2626549 RepID=UPI0033A0A9C3